MANGFDAVMKRSSGPGCRHDAKLGSRRIFAPQFKLQVLDSYRSDSDCRGNQRATARKYGIHRRQIQKWLQAEPALRGAARGVLSPSPSSPSPSSPSPPPIGPVDLSLKSRTSEPLAPAPAEAWDLSRRRDPHKVGYEVEAPPPPPPLRSFRLFRPFLLDDNFEEVQLPAPCTDCARPRVQSAFEPVAPRPCCYTGYGAYGLRPYGQTGPPALPGLS